MYEEIADQKIGPDGSGAATETKVGTDGNWMLSNRPTYGYGVKLTQQQSLCQAHGQESASAPHMAQVKKEKEAYEDRHTRISPSGLAHPVLPQRHTVSIGIPDKSLLGDYGIAHGSGRNPIRNEWIRDPKYG